MPVLTSTEPQLFLPLVSLSRPILNDTQALLFAEDPQYQKRGLSLFSDTVSKAEQGCASSYTPEVGAPLNS